MVCCWERLVELMCRVASGFNAYVLKSIGDHVPRASPRVTHVSFEPRKCEMKLAVSRGFADEIAT